MSLTKVIWFRSYDPGRGLRKYMGTINHLADRYDRPACGARPAYAKARLVVSGQIQDGVPLDCTNCRRLK